MQRRQFLSGAAGTALAASTPAFIGPLSGWTLGSSDTLTSAALDPDAVETFGSDANPSFVFRADDDDGYSSLESWADSDNREIKREIPSLNMMVVSTTWQDIGRPSTFGIQRISGGAQSLDYLDWIDANMTHERPPPVTDLIPEGEWSLDLGWQQSFSLMVRTFSTDTTPNPTGLAFDADAPEATLTEAREHVHADDTLVTNTDTSGLTVAVIDTGVNDGTIFGDRILDASTNFTGDQDSTVAEDGTDAVADGDGHGTWVGACMAGSNGFAPDANVLALKALGDDGSGQTADIVAAVDKAIDESADVACLSLGSPLPSEALAEALTEAREAGVFCAVAVGNDRVGSVFVNSPASSEAGFGVQACNVPESGERDDTQVAYFGNVGPAPQTDEYPLLAAPGMSITIDLPNSPSTLSGTSMAAPMVAGGAAMVRASEGTDVDATWDRLTSTAYPLSNAGETEAKYGLLDVTAAIDNAEPEESPEDVRSTEAEARDGLNETLSAIF